MTQVLNTSGDGANAMACPVGVAVDAADNVYVAAFSSSNAFKITPVGVASEIIDASGDGTHALGGTLDVAVDGAGNVFVTGNTSDNGGAVHVHGTLNLDRVLLSGNTAEEGGALHFHGADGGSLLNVTISGNSATNAEGGAIWTDTVISVTNCSFGFESGRDYLVFAGAENYGLYSTDKCSGTKPSSENTELIDWLDQRDDAANK